MVIMEEYVTERELRALITARGYRTEAIMNVEQMADDAADLRIVGYNLLGPRKHKKVVIAGANGLYRKDEAVLWCDAVDYSSKKVGERKAKRR